MRWLRVEIEGLGEAGKELEKGVNEDIERQAKSQGDIWITFKISENGRRIMYFADGMDQLLELSDSRVDFWKISLNGHLAQSKEIGGGSG